MRTYHKETTKRTSKRTLIAVLSTCAVIVAALAIILPIALTGSDKPDPDGQPLPTVKPISFVMPLETYTIGMEFKIDELIYSSTLNQWRTHSGVDFIAPSGTSVLAIADGTVTEVKNTTLDGTVISITHKDGYVSIYKSLGETVEVSAGEQVSAGAKIGVVDVTMITEQAEGAHLHLELTKNGTHVNPLDYIPYLSDK